MTNNTKNELGRALYTLLGKKNLDRITVADITGLCGLNRQTFYYHFHDVYELAEWLIDREVAELASSENAKTGDWHELLRHSFPRLTESKSVALHLYRSRGWHHIVDYVYRRVSPLLEERARNLVAELQLDVPEEDLLFVVRIYQYALSGVLDVWLSSGMKDSVPGDLDRLFRLLDGSIEHTLSNFDRRAATTVEGK